MSIVSFNTLTPGLVGVAPRIVELVVTDDLTDLTTAGFLNRQGQVFQGFNFYQTDVIFTCYNYNVSTGANDFGIFRPLISGTGEITLDAWENPGDVLLPVVDGDFANFNGTSGQIKDFGYSPSDATKSKVAMVQTPVIVNNLPHFSDVNGTLSEVAANVTNFGDIYAGASSGTAGRLRSYPSSSAKGYLGVTGVANAADTGVEISNDSHGQATTHLLPDPVNANAKILVGAGTVPFTSGHFPVASGTGGLMVDSALAATNIQDKTNIIAARTSDIGGGGAGPIDVIVPNLLSGSPIVASIQSSSNAVAVAKAEANGALLRLTFTGDPGASCFVNYIACVVAQ